MTPPNRSAGLLLAVGIAAVAALAHADDASFNVKAGTVVGGGSSGNAGGAELYAHICQGCHMPGAQGAVGAGHYPKLAGDPALVSWEYAAVTVLNGRKGMPAFGSVAGQPFEFGAVRLSDAQVADVVNYVRGNFGNHYKPGATAKLVANLPHPAVAKAP